VLFSTAESLLPAATGANPNLFPAPEYLYDRVLASGQTKLVDVDNGGAPISPEGAILGNGTRLTSGSPPLEEYLPADYGGTTTNAISSDGAKIFFETPPPNTLFEEPREVPVEPVHLYMRENDSQTVALDNPASEGSARYEGASQDGSLVFFTSNEGLGGDTSTETQLYEFNTTAQQIGPAPAMSAIPISAGDPEGATAAVTAIANDGSRVYFVAGGVLAANANAHGQTAVEMQPNLYVFDTASGQTTFIATLAERDVVSEGFPGGLVAEPDVNRPAAPTPDGSVLAFVSAADLTGQNSSGFAEVYRYAAGDGSLTCVSCTPQGVAPTGDAGLGNTAGGSYAPPGLSAPLSADGSRVFFDTPDALVAGDLNSGAPPSPVFGTASSTDVYEWENGQVALISGGASASPSTLSGTTPSGNDVFFISNASLTAPADGGYLNVYDARVGGGFPAGGEQETSACAGQGCRTPSGPAPVFSPPGSALFQGAGNPPPPTAVKPKPRSAACRKGFVRRRVGGRSRCVKRATHRTKAKHRTKGKRAGAHGSTTGKPVHRGRVPGA
jgi:hypothetical protein